MSIDISHIQGDIPPCPTYNQAEICHYLGDATPYESKEPPSFM